MADVKKKKRMWRLLSGGHAETSPEGKPVHYSKGDTFESTGDLERFNAPNSTRFLCLTPDEPEEKPPVVTQGELLKMKTEELLAFAADNEVEVGNTKNRNELVKLILADLG